MQAYQEKLWGTDIMIGSHTVVFAEGTDEDLNSPGFDQRFPLTYIEPGCKSLCSARQASTAGGTCLCSNHAARSCSDPAP